MKIRNRVKELRFVKASELYANPRNWRTHPKEQQDALRGVLAEIGYADALIARETPEGDLELIDGHLRAETTPDQEVPVLIVDVNQDEANKLLTILDPLAGMAEADVELLEGLLLEVQTDNQGLQNMLDALAAGHAIDLSGSLPDEPGGGDGDDGANGGSTPGAVIRAASYSSRTHSSSSGSGCSGTCKNRCPRWRRTAPAWLRSSNRLICRGSSWLASSGTSTPTC